MSYVATAEKERVEAVAMLTEFMHSAAITIQSMYRCSKSQSLIEDILLRLQAAAVLQGIVRKRQKEVTGDR